MSKIVLFNVYYFTKKKSSSEKGAERVPQGRNQANLYFFPEQTILVYLVSGDTYTNILYRDCKYLI